MPQTARVDLNNPEMLKWARNSANITLDEMAAHFDKSSEEIEAWEDGSRRPTYRQLQKFAKKVQRAVATLYLPAPPEEPPAPPDCRMHPREQRGYFSAEALAAFRALRHKIETLRPIMTALDLPSQMELPHWPSLAPFEEHAEALRETLQVSVSDQLRWKNPYEALNGWRDRLFEIGVVSHVFPVPVSEFRAFSLLHMNLGAIGISSKDAVRARIFSLFHEVAHLCLRLPAVSGEVVSRSGEMRDIDELEHNCDRFAAEFLLPRNNNTVLTYLRELSTRFDKAHAEECASRFKVSKYVVARRLLEDGRIEEGNYWSTVDEWRETDREMVRRKSGSRGGNYVRTTVSHAGKRYVETVLEARDRGIITTYEATKLLSLKSQHLPKAEEMVVS